MASASVHDTQSPFSPNGLKAVFTGEHAWCGEKLMLNRDLDDGVPLHAFFAGGGLTAALNTYAATHGASDRRAVASMWSLYYFSMLTIPTIVARRAGRVIPVAPQGMTIALNKDGLPRALGIADDGKWCDTGDGETLPGFVQPLIHDHLAPIILSLKTQAGMAPKLAWNNAAVYIDYAFNATQTDVSSSSDNWASRPLFEQSMLPDGTANPFYGCLRHETNEGQPVCRRKVCCLRYLLPGIPSCGELCALPSQRRQ